MSLTDALDRLAHESDQLKYHASQNTDQAGPFTSAYLYLEPGSNVLSLIRDAAPKEKRPFKILSAPNPPPNQQADFGVDKRPGVQLKTEAVLTPLKSLRARRGQPGELDATLRAADELLAAIADSYHMAKYQAHVHALAQQHAEQQRELAAIQAEIEAFSSRPAKKPEPEPEREELSVDDAIKAEEAALRELERSIAPLRRTAPASPASPRSPRSPMAARSPHSPASPKTPKSKTPARPTTTPSRALHFPGTTPRRPSQTPKGRFEPLHLFGTPRAKTPQVPPPALRESIRRDEPVGRSIFGPGAGRRSTQQQPLDASVRKEPLDASTKGLGASTSERPMAGSTGLGGSTAKEPQSLASSTLQPPSLGTSANAPATPAHAPPKPAAAAPTPAPPTPAPPTPAPQTPAPAPPAESTSEIDATNPAVVSGVVSQSRLYEADPRQRCTTSLPM